MDNPNIITGKNIPTDINALIEIPKGGGHIKYEFNQKMGAMTVDRLRDSSMLYPINYGFIPGTLSGDGDPLDILVICDHAIQTGVIIPARPIGVLIMEDEYGLDVKILAVPADRLTSAYLNIQTLNDISEGEKNKLAHFFKHYKDLEEGRWSKISGWEDVDAAHDYIRKAIEAAKQGKTPPLPPPAKDSGPKP